MDPDSSYERYRVAEFRPQDPTSLDVPYESIDLDIYKEKARCVAFMTSEKRIVNWVKVLNLRYYINSLNNRIPNYRCTWSEQPNATCASKCYKIAIHLYCSDLDDQDSQIVVITVFISTGRIMVQGKCYKEWAAMEFPIMKDMVDKIETSPSSPKFSASLPSFLKSHMSL